jgi:hypothetical protein
METLAHATLTHASLPRQHEVSGTRLPSLDAGTHSLPRRHQTSISSPLYTSRRLSRPVISIGTSPRLSTRASPLLLHTKPSAPAVARVHTGLRQRCLHHGAGRPAPEGPAVCQCHRHMPMPSSVANNEGRWHTQVAARYLEGKQLTSSLLLAIG